MLPSLVFFTWARPPKTSPTLFEAPVTWAICRVFFSALAVAVWELSPVTSALPPYTVALAASVALSKTTLLEEAVAASLSVPPALTAASPPVRLL